MIFILDMVAHPSQFDAKLDPQTDTINNQSTTRKTPNPQLQVETDKYIHAETGVRKELTGTTSVHAVIHPRRGFHAIPHLLLLSFLSQQGEGSSCPEEDPQAKSNPLPPVQVRAEQARDGQWWKGSRGEAADNS